MAKTSGRNNRAEEGLELKLTPMIDVVFQLLIFFLCATKFPEPEGILKCWLPKNKGQATSIPDIDPGSVRLILRRAGEGILCEYQDESSPTGFSAFPQAQVWDRHNKRYEIWPNYDNVAGYLAAAKANYEKKGEGEEEMPVILDFSPDVPWKHVVELLNICAGLDLTNIQIAAPEMPYD